MAKSAETKCPACGGTNVTVIRHQGEEFFQCVTPKFRPGEKEAGTLPTGTCKFWSTKWRPSRVN